MNSLSWARNFLGPTLFTLHKQNTRCIFIVHEKDQRQEKQNCMKNGPCLWLLSDEKWSYCWSENGIRDFLYLLSFFSRRDCGGTKMHYLCCVFERPCLIYSFTCHMLYVEASEIIRGLCCTVLSWICIYLWNFLTFSWCQWEINAHPGVPGGSTSSPLVKICLCSFIPSDYLSLTFLQQQN